METKVGRRESGFGVSISYSRSNGLNGKRSSEEDEVFVGSSQPGSALNNRNNSRKNSRVSSTDSTDSGIQSDCSKSLKRRSTDDDVEVVTVGKVSRSEISDFGDRTQVMVYGSQRDVLGELTQYGSLCGVDSMSSTTSTASTTQVTTTTTAAKVDSMSSTTASITHVTTTTTRSAAAVGTEERTVDDYIALDADHIEAICRGVPMEPFRIDPADAKVVVQLRAEYPEIWFELNQTWVEPLIHLSANRKQRYTRHTNTELKCVWDTCDGRVLWSISALVNHIFHVADHVADIEKGNVVPKILALCWLNINNVVHYAAYRQCFCGRMTEVRKKHACSSSPDKSSVAMIEPIRVFKPAEKCPQFTKWSIFEKNHMPGYVEFVRRYVSDNVRCHQLFDGVEIGGLEDLVVSDAIKFYCVTSYRHDIAYSGETGHLSLRLKAHRTNKDVIVANLIRGGYYLVGVVATAGKPVSDDNPRILKIEEVLNELFRKYMRKRYVGCDVRNHIHKSLSSQGMQFPS